MGGAIAIFRPARLRVALAIDLLLCRSSVGSVRTSSGSVACSNAGAIKSSLATRLSCAGAALTGAAASLAIDGEAAKISGARSSASLANARKSVSPHIDFGRRWVLRFDFISTTKLRYCGLMATKK